MNENNVAPILIDEIDEEFFSNKDRGNNLIVNVSNLSTSNFDFMKKDKATDLVQKFFHLQNI